MFHTEGRTDMFGILRQKKTSVNSKTTIHYTLSPALNSLQVTPVFEMTWPCVLFRMFTVRLGTINTIVCTGRGVTLQIHAYQKHIPVTYSLINNVAEIFFAFSTRFVCYILVFTDLEFSYESGEELHVFVPHKTHFQP